KNSRTAAPTKRASAPARTASPPRPGRGETVYMLEVPFSERAVAAAAGARWYSELGHAYVGRALPTQLHNYRPKPYSWAAWLEQDLRGAAHRIAPLPDATTGSFTLRDDQEDAVAAILIAHRDGAPEALLADDVGTGKTLMAVAA